MEADTQAHVAFFLTGRRSGTLDDVDGLSLRPALFAGYRDLTRLRYDYPLVLVAGRSEGNGVQSLSGLVDQALEAIAHGSDGERLRQHAQRIEQEIRVLLVGGATGTLSAVWDTAVARLAPEFDDMFADSARRTRAAIKVDGAVIDCDVTLPSRLLQHAWSAAQQRKSDAFRADRDRLVQRLNDILTADFEQSEEGRSATRLKAAVGAAFDASFDFDAMSRMLSTSLPPARLPESRRRRIRQLLDVLGAQRFFAVSPLRSAYPFLFDSCSDALAAFRERMPELIELARAMAMAELEIDGQYIASRHDALFEQFGANGLDPQELAPFPDYLVCVNASRLAPADHVQLLEILASELPIKVLLQIDDILEESLQGEGNLTKGMRIRQLASMAMGLNTAYVLQSSSSNLYRVRERIASGLSAQGPALFSVFSGAGNAVSDLPAYIVSAAAMESRAFPAFSYDPSAGPDWASRFSLDTNTHADLDWPISTFSYEELDQQRVTEELAFTVVDFVASDARYGRHLARVPRAGWNGSMIPVDESLRLERKGMPDQVPSVLMVDGLDVLHKVIVDERLLREARRCRELWHSLQELGGVHNSHAERLLARERNAWEARVQADAVARDGDTSPAGVALNEIMSQVANNGASAPTAVASAPERSPDEAYIETARCSTCNECTQINNRMFAYNANKQAFIADITAGTYAQLVEAAESCQVSIIHPGKPRNPNEPGLERLLERAAAFV